MELSSKLTLEMLGKPFLLEKRIELLHAIEEHGSISKAAKAVPMSYKSAWEAVDSMNALSPEPIVYRETGGRDGGGTTITAYGQQLLKNYGVLKEEHRRFLEKLSELTDIQSGAFKTIGRLAMQISARNQIQAEVVSVDSQNVNAKILLKLKSGKELLSVITKEAVEDLHIEEHQTVIAIFKSSTVILSKKAEDKSNENSLEGIVRKIDRDVENTKTVVDIGNHDTIVSVMPTSVVEKMEIIEGSSVIVMIKANDIMIGK
ncbi:TOBE domain-containing protein [Sulfurovum sp. XTW-4]|uniref:TOBE domain-containing protein n=1 Tax=Sulfurovum xiamenensis TaxID=3019066 RepID=A0ABT7QT09_9BACT|nr:TOBE domain-containing protein [Sulfurovum xiamenensis]MDM5264222.1 TOBE domain-containing protein [Sulfurovum xiamenensis]